MRRPLGNYVMENILFKVSYPAEFHAQTAAEAAIELHPQVVDRLEAITEIRIATHESAMRIIDKKGELTNPADRDHCLQYIVAVSLLHGDLVSEHYEDAAAADPRIDLLRSKMIVTEEPRYSVDYLDLDVRSIANRIEVHFSDGSKTDAIEVEFPLGHRRRRAAAQSPLERKFRENASSRFERSRVDSLMQMFAPDSRMLEMRVSQFMDQFVGRASTPKE